MSVEQPEVDSTVFSKDDTHLIESSDVEESQTSAEVENIATVASSSMPSENLQDVTHEQENDKLQDLCTNAFSKMSSYLHGEIDSSIEDYSLLEKMNLATIEKYQAMHQMAQNVGDNLHSLNQKFSDLQPYLDQIEKIESDVSLLEQSAYKLDLYSKHLEEKFKQLSKR